MGYSKVDGYLVYMINCLTDNLIFGAWIEIFWAELLYLALALASSHVRGC